MVAVLAPHGCATGPERTDREWIERLRSTIESPVTSRGQNHENSELVEQALDEGVLNDMTRSQVRSAIGQGQSCRVARCQQLGFQEDDWLYTVGVDDTDEVGQRPLIIVGFNRFGTVDRVWSLRLE